MPTCQPCGRIEDEGAATCPVCGEASWSGAVEVSAVEESKAKRSKAVKKSEPEVADARVEPTSAPIEAPVDPSKAPTVEESKP